MKQIELVHILCILMLIVFTQTTCPIELWRQNGSLISQMTKIKWIFQCDAPPEWHDNRGIYHKTSWSNRPCEALILSDEQQESWISTSDSDCGCFTDLCVKQQEAQTVGWRTKTFIITKQFTTPQSTWAWAQICWVTCLLFDWWSLVFWLRLAFVSSAADGEYWYRFAWWNHLKGFP